MHSGREGRFAAGGAWPPSPISVLQQGKWLAPFRYACNTRGRPYRVLYIFDPRRVALLLLGGDKTGDDRWYEKNIALADQLYDNYLSEIQEEDDAKDDKVQ